MPDTFTLTLALITTAAVFAVGLASGALLMRGKARASAPAVALAPVPAPAPAPAVEAAGAGMTLELHLVLNVLNRVVMALHADENSQDGIADLADYLRASYELQRRPSQAAMVNTLSAYWRLSRWVHGQRNDALHVDAQVPRMAPEVLARCCEQLTRVIRDLEGASRADASIRVSPGQPDGAHALITVVGLSDSDAAVLANARSGWTRESGQLTRHLEMNR